MITKAILKDSFTPFEMVFNQTEGSEYIEQKSDRYLWFELEGNVEPYFATMRELEIDRWEIKDIAIVYNTGEFQPATHTFNPKALKLLNFQLRKYLMAG